MGTERYLKRKGMKEYDSNSSEYTRDLATLALFKGDEGAEKEATFIIIEVKKVDKNIWKYR